MTDDEGAAHAKLLAEYPALEEEYAGQDEFPEEIDTRLGELEQAMEKLENRPLIFEQTEIAWAGAFVTLDRYGALAVYRGYVRPEDEPRDESTVQDGVNPALVGQGDDLATSDGDGSDTHANVGTIITSGGQELCLNLGDARHQATRFMVSSVTSTPSLNLIPSMTFGN